MHNRFKKALPNLMVGAAVAIPAAVMSIQAQERLSYPETKKGDVVETLHGVKIADPYRWLEDADSAETKAWVEAQNKLTFSYLNAIPARDKIKARLTKLLNYERYGIPFQEGGKYFYTRNDGLQNQSVLYVADSLKSNPRVLLDPNKLSKDGTVALTGYTVSEDGKYLAYGISEGGSDWQQWKVRDIKTGKDTNDHVKWVKFSGASWAKNGSGFYYSRYDEPKGGSLQESNYYQKLYFHKLGTPQNQDKLIYERKDEKEWGFDGTVSDDGRYLIIVVWQGSGVENRLFYKDLNDKSGKVHELFAKNDAMYTFLGNKGSVFYLRTDKDAPKGRIVSLDVKKGGALKDIVPQGSDVIEGASILSDRLIVNYLQDAHSFVRTYDLKGKAISEISLPGVGSAGGFGGDQDDKETFYSFTSYTVPATIFRYDVKTGKSDVFRRPKVDFNPAAFETKQVFFSSKDGTRVPMFLTYKKGLELDGQNPTLLYGYGGFSANETPYFSTINLTWIEMGGIYASVVLRGGAEYGEEWHKAGTKEKKQNVFDDFIAAAEYLIDQRYTSTPKLACSGASNGGLLVGAMLTQRPDLFGATLPAVGVMDMLRFDKFTIGWAWTTDYGDPDNAEDFAYIYKYSPLHNLKPGTKYPPTLITTADHDDRVVPAHSFKFAAAMQAAQAGDAPVLIRIETRAGHGAGKPIQKIIEETADSYAFLVKNLEMELPEGFGRR